MDLRDQSVPAEHVDWYASAIPQAQVHLLPGRDHQLNDDLGDVANAIRSAYLNPKDSARRECPS